MPEMSNSKIDGSYELDTIRINERFYVNIDDVIGWLKVNQKELDDEMMHWIITALVRCKNKHK